MPVFYEFLIECCETLRIHHPNVEKYGLPKILKLMDVNDKIKTRGYVDAHLLDNYLSNVVNSPDKKSFAKASNDYKDLIKGYQNGRRNS